MPRLTPQHWKTLYALYQKLGFYKDREKGDHIVMKREGSPRPIILPKYSEVDVGIIASNNRTAELSREKYLEMIGVVLTKKIPPNKK